MKNSCQLVVFSNKAYNAIIQESFDKHPVETGGILLGHILDNGIWIVMEVLPPGMNSIFEHAYFEYDSVFVNYIKDTVANQYQKPLELLGLWHRHPGSMDVFSSTDDGTNTKFARINNDGAISGLVNIDPRFRLTMYHLDCPARRPMGRPDYSVVDVEVGDDLIPEEYFELRYFDGDEANLHPMVALRDRERNINRNLHDERKDGRSGNIDYEDSIGGENPDGLDVQAAINRGLPPCDVPRNNTDTPNFVNDFFHFWRASKRKWLLILGVIVVLIPGAFIFRSCKDNVEKTTSWIKELTRDDKTENDTTDRQAPMLSVENLKITQIGGTETLRILNSSKEVAWSSSNPEVATADNGNVTGVANGTAIITAMTDGEKIGQCKVLVDIEGEAEGDEPGEVTSGEAVTAASNASGDTGVSAIVDTSRTYHHGKVGSIKVGHQFSIPLKKIGNPTVTFELSNPDIATIDSRGVVTATNTGSTTITILCNGQESDMFELKIN